MEQAREFYPQQHNQRYDFERSGLEKSLSGLGRTRQGLGERPEGNVTPQFLLEENEVIFF